MSANSISNSITTSSVTVTVEYVKQIRAYRVRAEHAKLVDKERYIANWQSNKNGISMHAINEWQEGRSPMMTRDSQQVWNELVTAVKAAAQRIQEGKE